MALKYVTDGAFGTGEHRPLHAAEVDENFWQLDQRITDLEGAPSDAVGIANIEVIGSQMMIYLTDASSYGPFTLPTAQFRFRDEWAPGASYAKLDLVSVRQRGLFLVQVAHIAASTFDPAVTDGGGNAIYSKVFGEDTYIFDIGFSYPGKPGQGVEVGESFLEHIFVRPASIAADFGVSKARLGVAAATTLVFGIRKNDVNIGTLTFNGGSTTGVFAWTIAEVKTFAVTDVIGIQRPSGIDANAKRLVITIAASITD